MKTIVTLSKDSGIADVIRASVETSEWRVIHHENPWDSGLLQIPGAVDILILEGDLVEITPIRLIEKLKKLQPGTPILIYAGEVQQEWQEEAYLSGAEYILPKPVREKLLNVILERMVRANIASTTAPLDVRESREILAEPQNDVSRMLESLRNFSEVLTHSLLSDSLPKHFLQLLREILGVNRAAIFLRKPFFTIKPTDKDPGPPRLHASCAIGLPNGLLEYFELTFEGGIGRHLHRHGRILKSTASEIRNNPEIQKEFELLGARVAIPILDRETLIGVAVFDERLTGEPFSSGELALVFHALEELGMAIKNSWLHDQLTNSHGLLTDILDKLTNGCVVVGRDLTVMHSNPAARKFLRFGQNSERKHFQFSDLPQPIGSRVFESLKTGETIASFRYKPHDDQEGAYNISVIPFHQDKSSQPDAALLLIEDFTQIQHSQDLEIEASNLRTLRSMAGHLSHEIGNALVPMSTHQQLLGDHYEDPEFRGSLSLALSQGIKRISRLSNQLLFLTRDDVARNEAIPAIKLIQDAFSDAQMLYGMDGRKLEIEKSEAPLHILGDRASLQHALSETLLNALQSSPPDSPVNIRLETVHDRNSHWTTVHITDKGPGFTADLASKAAAPFFSTRTVGPGLGLTVAKKIIENHKGELRLSTSGQKGTVSITLPIKNGHGGRGGDYSAGKEFSPVDTIHGKS